MFFFCCFAERYCICKDFLSFLTLKVKRAGFSGFTAEAACRRDGRFRFSPPQVCRAPPRFSYAVRPFLKFALRVKKIFLQNFRRGLKNGINAENMTEKILAQTLQNIYQRLHFLTNFISRRRNNVK